MPAGLVIASTGLLVKLWWLAAVAVVWVALYRSAFPRGSDEALKAARQDAEAAPQPAPAAVGSFATMPVPPGAPVVDHRPRVRCPRCEELIPLEASLCRFCGYRYPAKRWPQ